MRYAWRLCAVASSHAVRLLFGKMKIYQWYIGLGGNHDSGLRIFRRPREPVPPVIIESLRQCPQEVVMADLDLWRPTHAMPVEEMRGTVAEETNYAIGWMLSTLLTITVVCAVWTFGV